MAKILIVTGVKPAKLVRYAADELAGYIKRLFHLSVRVAATPGKFNDQIITLDAHTPPIPSRLSDQGYVLRPVEFDNRPMFQVGGGSAKATMWAVYDLVERWGVRYQLHGDLLPDHPGRMRLPKQDILCEPDLKWRAFRTYNDFANNECTWAAADYQMLIDQLAKMRMNSIVVVSRPQDPFADLQFKGARKTLAVSNFGFRPVIHPDHPGFELFRKSGDADRGVFVNPDLDGHSSYEKAHAAGKRYLQKIFRMAHARGMSCCLKMIYTDYDPAIKDRLLELTKTRHKAARGQVTRIRYGDCLEGPSLEVARCMSIRNPLFLELIAATIQAHIDCVPDADLYCLGTTEFRESAADCQLAWKKLDRKYGVNKIATLDQLVEEARTMAEGAPDRSERSLRADIVALHVLDVLLNEQEFDLSRARKNARIIATALSPELHRFLPLIFPRGTPYIAEMGYRPGYVARRADTLKLDEPGQLSMSLVISLEDDNIGLVPQLTGPAVHKLVQALRSSGADGFYTRQWLHSNLLPTLHYLTHASWERGWTPAKAYKHFFEDLCGPRAMAPIATAFRALENLTESLHAVAFHLSFPLPAFMAVLWENWPATHTPERLSEIARIFERITNGLEQAVKVSKPAGKAYLQSLERHCRHAVFFVNALTDLSAAHEAKSRADAAQKARDFDELDQWSATAAAHLEQCACNMRNACEAFAEGVCDRCGLGALATLNNYWLDVANAYATVAKIRASFHHVVES